MTDLHTENARLRAALEKALNYIENTESELGITLDCGDAARAALATPAPDNAVSRLVEAAQWARNRLEVIADDTWHGDARDFKRALIGVFADFDDALASCGSAIPLELRRTPPPTPAPDAVQDAAIDIADIENGGKRWHGEDHRVVAVRWEPYKPDGQRQMKANGRWQEQVGSGDYWRWQNCDRPAALRAIAGDRT